MKKFLKILIALLFVAAIGFGAYRGVIRNKAVKQSNASMGVSFADMNKDLVSKYSLKEDEKVKNVLLVGSDKRGTETGYGRADAIIVATVDQKNQQLKLTNLIEDSYMEVPGYGKNKLSMAYSMGGISLLYETIAANYGIKLDDYVVYEFKNLVNAIDKIGGVKVELTDFEVSYMQLHYTSVANEVQTGPFILNGTQALAYIRIKQDAAGDFGRALRLNSVISSVYSDLTMKSVDALRDLVNELLKDTASDIEPDDARGYLASVLALSTAPLKTKTLPDEGMYQATAKKGQTLFVIDTDKVKEAASDYIYNPIESGDISKSEE